MQVTEIRTLNKSHRKSAVGDSWVLKDTLELSVLRLGLPYLQGARHAIIKRKAGLPLFGNSAFLCSIS